VRSEEDDGSADDRLPQLLLKIQATDSWKAHIQNDAAGTIEPRIAQEIFRLLERYDAEACLFQQTFYRGERFNRTIACRKSVSGV
jgi:hypothetical protein